MTSSGSHRAVLLIGASRGLGLAVVESMVINAASKSERPRGSDGEPLTDETRDHVFVTRPHQS